MKYKIFEIRPPIIWDGAMGTEIQRRRLDQRDFGGFEGLNEILIRTRPDVIEDIHRSYLLAGADVIETNTFGANGIVFREYGCEQLVREINRDAAILAKRLTKEYSTDSRPRFVAGSVGPTTKIPSLGQVSVRELLSTYKEQILGLLEGGVDLIQIETAQDPLQAKCAVVAANEACDETGIDVPIICLFSFEQTGKTLVGSDPSQIITTFSGFGRIIALGTNCALGPEGLQTTIKEFSRLCPLPIMVMPNASIPQIVDGNLIYPLSPMDFAKWMKRYVEEFGVSMVGGCCGTTPEHISALVNEIRDVRPKSLFPMASPSVSSLYSSQTLSQEPKPCIVGERTNVNGSKEFKQCLENGDITGMLRVAKHQVAEGAHILDVSLSLVGRNEVEEIERFIPLLAREVDIPLMIDSTNPQAVEVALQLWPGRAVVNSVNLEDGGVRLRHLASISRKYNTCLVALTIDEQGMALSCERKIEIAKRIIDILVQEFGFRHSDIIVDPLTFTLASGDQQTSAVETLKALSEIKRLWPETYTLLGISNISYGLKAKQRRILNSVFLYHALKHGLDIAILNAGKILPFSEIPKEKRERAEALIFNQSDNALRDFIIACEDAMADEIEIYEGKSSVEERIRDKIIRGEKDTIVQDIYEALQKYSAIDIITKILLPGMEVVGERFKDGKMPLPFVLKSAETMKIAIGCLEPHLQTQKEHHKSTIVLATVKGDVHDIGKNLVDIILSSNNFRVINLGIKQDATAIINAIYQENANAVGLSGLLVKSVEMMGEILQEMREKGITIPVLLGGAALTRRYVNEILAFRYDGPVVYCKDAFEGLRCMEKVALGLSSTLMSRHLSFEEMPKQTKQYKPPPPPPNIPKPGFLGLNCEEINIDDVIPYINRVSLFRGQWGFRRGDMTEEEWQKKAREEWEPLLLDRLQRYKEVFRPRAIWGFYPAHAEGDSITIWDQDGAHKLETIVFPRINGVCISDFVQTGGEYPTDYLGLQLVTLGNKVSEREESLFHKGEYMEYLLLHGLGVEVVEACAEFVHSLVRKAWGISVEDAKNIGLILKKHYRGARFSFGYPGCPGLEAQKRLLDILGADRIGVSVTEADMMTPELTTLAIVIHHPQAHYLWV